MLSKLAEWVFKLWGWTLVGHYPKEQKKMIIAVASHTSYWDFPIGILFRTMYKVKIKFVIKAEIMKGPLGWLLNYMGAVPVNRSKAHNFVNEVVKQINSRDEIILTVAPEGKRDKVEKLKSGYYFMAKLAKIPILPIKFDWAGDKIILGDLFYPTDDVEKDLAYLDQYFRGTIGKFPEKSFT